MAITIAREKVMNEYKDLSKPIPNLKKYLNYISIEKSNRCTIDYLDRLILAQQYSVPFENIDIYDYHKQIDITTEKIYDKIVNNHRGGYCFELNAIFNRLLTACGYDAFPCLARVVKDGNTLVPSLHRLTLVKSNNEIYLCDVGYGGAQPGFAFKIEDGLRRTFKDGAGIEQTFKLEHDNGLWNLYHLTGDSWTQTIQFIVRKVDEVDFVAPNYFCCNHESVKFVQNRMVNIRTKNGNKSILNDAFINIENHNRNEITIKNQSELKKILDTHFGIKITE